MKIRKKILTIVLLTHNRVNYLKQSIGAILNQTYQDFELIIVDNYSTDKTPKFITNIDNPKFTYIRLGLNTCPTCGQTLGVKLVDSKYILITHDDDIMEKNMIEKQINFLKKNKNILALATNVSLIDENGKLIQEKLYNLNSDIIFDKFNYIDKYLQDKLWLPTSTIIYKTDVYKKIRKLFTPFSSSDVLEVFLMNSKGAVAIMSKPLLRYRQHSDQGSRKVDQSKPHMMLFKEAIKILKDKKGAKKILPKLYASLIKYKIQYNLFRNNTDILLEIRDEIIKKTNFSDRIYDEFIIAEIIFLEFGIDSIITKDIFYNILFKNLSYNSIQDYYKIWLHKLYNKKSLFYNSRNLKNIAILGSMLTAFIIVKDAINSGVNIIACLDSSKRRAEDKVLNIDILPFDDINNIEDKVDAIILSSEREHEQALKKIVKDRLKNKQLPIISWKEMLHKN